MKLNNSYKNVELIIEDTLLDKLEKEGIYSYPNECGGFLVGYYSKDFKILYITDFILPKNKEDQNFYLKEALMV